MSVPDETTMILTLITIALFLAAAALIGAGLPWRNRRGAKRCPRCRFDVSAATEKRCTECGDAWTLERRVTHRPFRKWRVGFGVILVLGSAVTGWVAYTNPADWTDATPRFVLRAMLDLTVDPPPTVEGASIPGAGVWRPAPKTPWESLVRQKQDALAIDHFVRLVRRSDGSWASLEALGRAAVEVQGFLSRAPRQTRGEGWLVMAALERGLGACPELDKRVEDPSAPRLGTWLESELQYPWVVVEPPLAVNVRLAESADPDVRRYAAERLARINHPDAVAALRRLLDDPVADVRADARHHLEGDASR